MGYRRIIAAVFLLPPLYAMLFAAGVAGVLSRRVMDEERPDA